MIIESDVLQNKNHHKLMCFTSFFPIELFWMTIFVKQKELFFHHCRRANSSGFSSIWPKMINCSFW
jgi:hypothetical protein